MEREESITNDFNQNNNNSSNNNNGNNNNDGNDNETDDSDTDSYITSYDHLLIHVREIRNESQLTSIISYIQDGYISIEQADEEKRQLKRMIRGKYIRSHHIDYYPLHTLIVFIYLSLSASHKYP